KQGDGSFASKFTRTNTAWELPRSGAGTPCAIKIAPASADIFMMRGAAGDVWDYSYNGKAGERIVMGAINSI
ncbi:MAG TPA: hypothetical protein DCZ10_01705, partial [Pelotomaculum sp.]|nr:hypothetical protein [Pelotomaculum sp.]